MPNRKAKARKQLKRKINSQNKSKGRTAKQYKKRGR